MVDLIKLPPPPPPPSPRQGLCMPSSAFLMTTSADLGLSSADVDLQVRSMLVAAKSRLQLMQSAAQPPCLDGGAFSSQGGDSQYQIASREGLSVEPAPRLDCLESAGSLGRPKAASSDTRFEQVVSDCLDKDICEVDDPSRLCVVCMEQQPEVVFIPCMHAVACQACTSKIVSKSNECPMCRTPLSASVPI